MLKRTLCLLSFAALLQMPGTLAFGQAVAAPSVIVERGVEMKTRDGVTLRADIYRPAAEGNYPVLLQRTPYNKDGTAVFGRRGAERGFMVVAQDVRGRGASEGEWYPFKHESDDGFDAVEWAAALPHSNGKVAMFGGSYVGATQMLAAITHPPHLAGICPEITASNYHEGWTYQGGAFEQWFNESWTSALAQETAIKAITKASNALVGSTVLPLKRYPVFNLDVAEDGARYTQTLAPYFLDWLDHPEYDDYWKRWSIEENYASIQVPALTITSWYDIFLHGSLNNYQGVKAKGGTEAARAGQRLLVNIGGHAGGGRTIGTIDFGPYAEMYDWDSVTLDYYDYLLLGKQNEYATAKPVRIFVMGENKWRDEDDWPLKRAKAVRYKLQSSGNANSAAGAGMLYTGNVEFRSEAPDRYVYDPANPVPTVGGPLCCDGYHLPAGPRDQAQVETRQDVLVYSTEPLDKDMEVTGPVMLDLFAASSAVDTDFTAKLVDLWPNGYAQNLTEGILRARYRESPTTAKLLTPGQIYEYKIDLWATSNVFLKGHRIRMEISSSNFPRFDRNLNTGKPASTDASMVKATNTIYHDAAHPSALVLPVAPR